MIQMQNRVHCTVTRRGGIGKKLAVSTIFKVCISVQ